MDAVIVQFALGSVGTWQTWAQEVPCSFPRRWRSGAGGDGQITVFSPPKLLLISQQLGTLALGTSTMYEYY
jgi:hypothetical protein